MLYEIWGVYLVSWFDSFYFIFFFAFNQVRRWTGEVGTMCIGFVIWVQQRCMKDIVNSPIGW